MPLLPLSLSFNNTLTATSKHKTQTLHTTTQGNLTKLRETSKERNSKHSYYRLQFVFSCCLPGMFRERHPSLPFFFDVLSFRVFAAVQPWSWWAHWPFPAGRFSELEAPRGHNTPQPRSRSCPLWLSKSASGGFHISTLTSMWNVQAGSIDQWSSISPQIGLAGLL